MYLLGWEEGGDAWRWRRSLRVWEKELLADCRALLHNVSLQDTTSDMWQWHLDLIGGYSVRGVYDMLTAQEHGYPLSSFHQVSSKGL